MRKLLLVLLILTGAAWAQGSFYQLPSPLPNAVVRVCPNPALANPCSSPVAIFGDQGLSQPLPNPYSVSSAGALGFWVASGQYTIQIGEPYNQVYVITLGGGFSLPSLTVDVRTPDLAKSGSTGAICNQVADDTAAIQSYLTYYGALGGGAGQHVTIQFPIGTCKITNMLVYEGNSGSGVRLLGQKGYSAGTDSSIGWFGPNFGTMLLMLGCNGCTIEQLDFVGNEIGNGGGKAQNIVWWDSSNEATPATFNLSSITRSGNIVTATCTASCAFASDQILKVAGSTGGTTLFNGTFRTLYSNSATTVSWIQNGANESGTASTGTITLYKSASSNNIRVERLQLISHEGFTSTISTISGAGPVTITTTAAHMVTAGDVVIAKGGSDSTYTCAYLVSTITSSTVLVANGLPGTGCGVSGTGSTGGTLTSGSTGMRLGHRSGLTMQVSALHADDLFVQGDQLGGSVTCVQADNGGNVKDFIFIDAQFNGCRYGFEGFQSGNFNVYMYGGGLVTPDTAIVNLASIDFVNNFGQITIDGAEVEAVWNRFFVNTASAASSNIHIRGLSFQASAPTDDTIITWGGGLFLSDSLLFDTRVAGSTPTLTCGNPLFSTLSCSLVSIGNFYANTNTGGSWFCPGFIPLNDGFSGNPFCPNAGNFYTSKTLNVTSIGDNGSTSNAGTGTIGPLQTILPRLTLSSNCTSSASPAVCVSATSGAVALPTTGTTLVVNTTAVSANANQQILLTQDMSTAMGTRLSVTCNTTANPVAVSARVAGTSFTITATQPVTNPACYQFQIIDF